MNTGIIDHHKNWKIKTKKPTLNTGLKVLNNAQSIYANINCSLVLYKLNMLQL